ncbi:hypothetical protein [Campylobacter ureolyticus]|uniref:DUF4102 domain-containing protein n=1 Tax=Campylobacter ureolyticus TaxID=827 RepID=A0A6N2RU90_9BACT
MANVGKINLSDKDIRELPVKDRKYFKTVGNPTELYIRVYPSGRKSFAIRYNNKFTTIKEFRQCY